MDIAFHFGLHCTDDDQLVRTLMKNAPRLSRDDIVVPGPGRYRPVLREAINTLGGAPASPEMQEAMLDAFLDHDAPARIVLSNENFLCSADRVIGDGMLYPKADKVAWFARLFPQAQAEAFLAIRNPATFLPALRARMNPAAFDVALAACDGAGLSWAGVVGRMRAAAPTLPITVWCDEDTPLIWPEVLRAVADLDEDVHLHHVHDRLADLILPEGLEKMTAYLKANPPQTEDQRRRVVSAFLDKYVPKEKLSVEPELPGWTEADIAAATDLYDADVQAIARIPGVRLILP